MRQTLGWQSTVIAPAGRGRGTSGRRGSSYSPGWTTQRAVEPGRERPPIERHGHPALLAGLEVDAGEPGEVAQRPGGVAGRRLDVDLDDLARPARSPVLRTSTVDRHARARRRRRRSPCRARTSCSRARSPNGNSGSMSSRSYQRWPMNSPSAYTARAVAVPGVVGERRRVLEPARERHRQPAAGLGVAGQHVDQRVADLLAGEPQLQHGGHVVEPRHRHRRPGVDDHDRVRVGGHDGGDELVLVAAAAPAPARSSPSVSQSSSVPTMTTATSAAGGDRRGRARCGRRPGPRRAPTAEAPDALALGAHRVVDRQLVAAALLELDRAADLRAAHAEERAAAHRLGDRRRPARRRRCTRHRPDGPHADLPVAGRVGHERPADVGGELRACRCPSAGGVSQYHVRRLAESSPTLAGRVVEAHREVAAHGRQVLGDRAAGLERDVEPAAGQAPRAGRARGRAGPARCRRPGAGRTGRTARSARRVLAVAVERQERRRRSSAAPSPAPRRGGSRRASPRRRRSPRPCRSASAPAHAPSASRRATSGSRSRSLTSPALDGREQRGAALGAAVRASRGRARRAATRPRCGCRTSR